MRASHIKAVRMPGWHVVYSSENYEVSPEPSEPQVRTSTLYLSVSGVSRWWRQGEIEPWRASFDGFVGHRKSAGIIRTDT